MAYASSRTFSCMPDHFMTNECASTHRLYEANQAMGFLKNPLPSHDLKSFIWILRQPNGRKPFSRFGRQPSAHDSSNGTVDKEDPLNLLRQSSMIYEPSPNLHHRPSWPLEAVPTNVLPGQGSPYQAIRPRSLPSFDLSSKP